MDKIIGNCSKHPGHNFVNCPLCEIERQKKLSKNFWDNVQKDVDRVNSESTPEGVTADPKDEEIAKWYNEAKEAWRKIEIYKDSGDRYKTACEAQDKEIARLKEAVKELVDGLEKIRGMGREQGEMNDTYCFNRCWHIADKLIPKHKQP